MRIGNRQSPMVENFGQPVEFTKTSKFKKVRRTLYEFVHSSVDYKAGELVCHAQSCKWLVGFSDLGDTLLSKDANGDPMDPHSMLAADTLRISYDEFIANKKLLHYVNVRQISKPTNFGKPTGMGEPKMVIQQRNGGEDTPHHTGPVQVKDVQGNLVPGYKGMRYCILMGGSGPCGGPGNMSREWNGYPITPMCTECLVRAKEIGDVWKKRWRENAPYGKHINRCIEDGQVITGKLLALWPWLQEWYAEDTQLAPGEIMQHYVGRVRGGLTFTEASNGYFQSLLAEITKMAYCQITRECYDRTYRIPLMLFENSIPSVFAGMQSPCYGSKAPGFFHDEVFAVHPRSVAPEAATRNAEIMRDFMRHVCPDYADAVVADPALQYAWNKAAVNVMHGGRLAIWTPGHDSKSCAECQA